MKTPISLLSDLNACAEARAFAATYPDLETAWLTCERGDWLLWFAAKRQVARTQLVFIACQCARLALPHAKDPCVRASIETAEAWTRGEGTIDAVRNARKAASAAYASADYAYAAYAAAASAASSASAAADARNKTLRQCAEIVRAALPTLPS